MSEDLEQFRRDFSRALRQLQTWVCLQCGHQEFTKDDKPRCPNCEDGPVMREAAKLRKRRPGRR